MVVFFLFKFPILSLALFSRSQILHGIYDGVENRIFFKTQFSNFSVIQLLTCLYSIQYDTLSVMSKYVF